MTTTSRSRSQPQPNETSHGFRKNEMELREEMEIDTPELRKQAEKSLQRQPEDVRNLSEQEMRHLIHELRVHQIELEMQNEEVHRIQLELEASRNRYSELYDFSPVGHLTLSEKGQILEANLTICSMLGVERSRLIGKPLYSYITKETQDIFYLQRQKLFETKTKQICELKLLKKDGAQFDAQLECIAIEDDEGNITQTRSVISDISKRKRAEAKLLESQERYKTLAEMSPAAILVLQKEKVVYANPEAEKIFGAASRAKLIGKSIYDLVHPDYIEIVKKRAAHIKKKTTPITPIVQKYIRCDGRIIDVEAVGVLINYDNKPSILSIFRDITQRKHSEEKLRESEERYRELFENAGTALRVFDAETLQIEDVNQASIDLHGYSKEELLSLRITDITADAEETMASIQNAIETGKSIVPVRNYKKKDGTIFTGEVHAGTFLSGGRKKIIGAVHDLTERIRADEARYLLDTAIEQSAETIMITDETGSIQYINPAFEKITGYQREEVVGQNPNILKSGKQDKGFYTAMWNKLTRGHRWTGNFINKKKDGNFFMEEASISPIRNGSGAITSYVAVKRDITEKIKMEAQLRQSQKMEAMGTLAGGIAHDFNNILTSVIGYTELTMRKIDKGSELNENLEEVFKAGKRAKDLVRQILAFSRQSEEERTPIQMSPIVKEAIKLLRASLPSTINIRQDIKSDLSNVMADPTQIHQIVMNLCTNAAHAMDEKGGELKISLSQVELGSEDSGHYVDMIPGHYLKLTVSDTGYGISPANIGLVFDLYFTTKEIGEGTGLGLSVVHGIVKSLGGEITVESKPGKKTVFTVYIPAIQIIPSQEKTAEPEPLPIGKERILFIDDEPVVAKIGKMALEPLGYDVEVRTSSIEALELVRVHPERFDLIITDMTMPQMTGDELTKELIKIRPDIPVILCTGFSNKMSKEQALRIGVRAFIMKPFVIGDLAATVRKVLDSGASGIPE